MHDTVASHKTRPALPLVLLAILGINWGLGFSLAKIGMTDGLQPLAYAAWQCVGAGLLLLAVAFIRRELPPVDIAHLRYYALAGITNVAIPNVVSFISVRHVPVGVIVLIVTLSPLLTYGLAQALALEPFNLRRASGIALGFAGALLILIPRTSLPEPDMVWWVLLSILTPSFYAASNLYIGWARPPDVASLSLAAAMQVAAGVALFPVALLAGGMHIFWPPFTTGEIANLAHIAVAGFGAFMFFEIIRLAGVVFLSQVGYVVCLAGVFWGWVFFAERHSVWIWAAMALIFCGLLLVTRTPRTRIGATKA